MCCSLLVIDGGVCIWIIRLIVFMLMFSFRLDVVIIVLSCLCLRFFLIMVCCFLLIELWWVWVSIGGVLNVWFEFMMCVGVLLVICWLVFGVSLIL